MMRYGARRSTLVATATASRSLQQLESPSIARAKLFGSVVPIDTPMIHLPVYETRRFSSETNAADVLSDLLNREHTEEQENNSTGMPDALKDLHDQLTQSDGWKVVTDDNSAMTKLFKTVDAVKVQVSFHCQDATERLAEEEEHDDQGEDNQEQQEENAAVRFTVSATKAGKTLFMVCIAQDSMVRIQNTAMAGTVQDVDVLHASGVNSSLYQGPEFTELAEDLQDAFHAYLEDHLGVNADVATYIIMQFDYKEQCQYVKFLEETKGLLA
jgi:complement component 1 Q subcomponent-binding protein, mitochondrial